jgi:hypothetical protein
MTKKVVKFRTDYDSEMVEVYINDKLWRDGNLWDFDFVRDAQELLEKIGVEVETEDYSYDTDEDEEE